MDEKFFRNSEFLMQNAVDALSHATCGITNGSSGNTDLIKVETISAGKKRK